MLLFTGPITPPSTGLLAVQSVADRTVSNTASSSYLHVFGRLPILVKFGKFSRKTSVEVSSLVMLTSWRKLVSFEIIVLGDLAC